MTSRDFCYWLQGHLELSPKGGLTEYQTEVIQKHLAMVFVHEIDPSFENVAELREIHSKPTRDPIYISGPRATTPVRWSIHADR